MYAADSTVEQARVVDGYFKALLERDERLGYDK
jgi:hypothetical protein